MPLRRDSSGFSSKDMLWPPVRLTAARPGPPDHSFLAPASRRPGTVASRTCAAGCPFQEFLGVVGPAPGERLELPPFRLVVGDEEVLDLVQSLPADFLQRAELDRVVRCHDDGDEAVVADGLAAL